MTLEDGLPDLSLGHHLELYTGNKLVERLPNHYGATHVTFFWDDKGTLELALCVNL